MQLHRILSYGLYVIGSESYCGLSLKKTVENYQHCDNVKILIRCLEFEKRELTQNTPPFQAQHWKILLTIRGSLEKTTCI